MSNRTIRVALPALITMATCGAAGTARADVESELRADLVGRFALTRSALRSECTDHYTDNQVVGGRISGSTGETFAAGEMVKVDNVKIGAFSGLDVNLSLVEPYRLSWREGPFDVYDQRRCRVQLHFDVPREVRKDRAKARGAIEAVVAVFADEMAARGDAAWNRRKVEPYPANWEAKKREWEAWKRSQTNVRVREKTEEVLEQADRVLEYMPGDAKYLASFGAGARARSDSWSSCESMLEATFYSTGGGDGEDSRGWADGQLVAWATELAHELADCYIDDK